jgi:hypothetical protein
MLLMLAATALAKPKVYTAVSVEAIPGLCPGERHKLEVLATDAAGKQGKVKSAEWKQFEMHWEIGPISTKGELAMPDDPRATWGKAGALTVAWIGGAAVHTELAVPVRYDCPQRIDRSGPAGDTGPRGSTGSTGADADGGDGQDGGDGRDGGDGHDVEVRVALAKEPTAGIDVLQIAARDLTDGSVTLAAVAARGGQLSIYANGGQGGTGGQGGSGGSGATGRNGGEGGDGGDGGRGGRGGKITLIVDPAAREYASRISAVSAAGAAGQPGLAGDGGAAYDPGTPGEDGHPGHDGQPGAPGPVPVTKVETVGPLW